MKLREQHQFLFWSKKSSSKSNTEASSFLNSKKVVKGKSSEAKRKALPVIKGNIMSPSKEPLMKNCNPER